MTQESPISDAWKQRLLTLKKGDVFLNRFSPDRLLFVGRQQPLHRGAAPAAAERQVAYSQHKVGEHD